MKQFAFIFSLLFLVAAYDENTIEDVKKKVTETFDQLPDNVKELIPGGLNMSNVPSIEEGEELMKERCLKYGTNESFNNFMVAKEDIQFCFRKLINYTKIKEEIEQAKPTGDLDNVFRKYCRKSPQLRGCISDFVEAFEPCMKPEERPIKYTIMNITDAMKSFICFKEGDRIALFIAEGGPDCLESKEEDIQYCLNSTLSKYIPKDVSTNDDNLSFFTLGREECSDLTALQKCIVAHLETCSEPTPANIVDSMFTFVRKVTPCKEFDLKKNAASSTKINILLTISAFWLLAAKLH